jgi:AcrR family transcriptional regulator
VRADAARNRAKVLAAAEEILAAQGLSARMDAIARRAGVGVGTVYRHFPTKETLYEAIMTSRFERLIEEASRLTDSGDPGEAFFTFFRRIVEESTAKKVLADALIGAGIDHKAGAEGTRARMRAAIEALLTNARRAGAVRREVRMPEVLALLTAATLAAERTGWDDGLRDRTLAVIFNGLRTPGVSHDRS